MFYALERKIINTHHALGRKSHNKEHIKGIDDRVFSDLEDLFHLVCHEPVGYARFSPSKVNSLFETSIFTVWLKILNGLFLILFWRFDMTLNPDLFISFLFQNEHYFLANAFYSHLFTETERKSDSIPANSLLSNTKGEIFIIL